MIEVSHLSTKFGDKLVHKDISLDVKKGEIFGLLGGSGSGKTTLLRQMILLDEIQKGDIKVLGRDLRKAATKDRDYLKSNWGVLFQFGALFSSMNVVQNVGVMLKENTKLPQDLIDDIAYTKLKMVGLEHSVGKLYPEELSGGMKKRVALARSLAMDPQIVFLDEPTSGLDPASAKGFDSLILELRDMLDLTVVVITHELNTIRNVLDRFSILHDSKIILTGSYSDAVNAELTEVDKFLKIIRE
jgi:phospholipid/cholesterol/gamma-HCH transport system ATP-binding protein